MNTFTERITPGHFYSLTGFAVLGGLNILNYAHGRSNIFVYGGGVSRKHILFESMLNPERIWSMRLKVNVTDDYPLYLHIKNIDCTPATQQLTVAYEGSLTIKTPGDVRPPPEKKKERLPTPDRDIQYVEEKHSPPQQQFWRYPIKVECRDELITPEVLKELNLPDEFRNQKVAVPKDSSECSKCGELWVFEVRSGCEDLEHFCANCIPGHLLTMATHKEEEGCLGLATEADILAMLQEE